MGEKDKVALPGRLPPGTQKPVVNCLLRSKTSVVYCLADRELAGGSETIEHFFRLADNGETIVFQCETLRLRLIIEVANICDRERQQCAYIDRVMSSISPKLRAFRCSPILLPFSGYIL